MDGIAATDDHERRHPNESSQGCRVCGHEKICSTPRDFLR
jgi:hypothetical protein